MSRPDRAPHDRRDGHDEDLLKAALHPARGDWLYFVTVNPKTGLTKFTASSAVLAKLQAGLGGGVLDLSCRVIGYGTTNPEYAVSANVGSGAAYLGRITVSFYSSVPAQRFSPAALSPDVTITYSRPWITSLPVPADDVGAAAQPSGCTASANG